MTDTKQNAILSPSLDPFDSAALGHEFSRTVRVGAKKDGGYHQASYITASMVAFPFLAAM